MNGNVALIRALRGPVMMMTLGGMLVADHFSRFSFGRTWPVLLIVMGIMKLLERSGAPAPPTDPPSSSPYAPVGGN